MTEYKKSRALPAHQIRDMVVQGAVNPSIVEAGYEAILDLRRDLLDSLDRGCTEEVFKDKAHQILMYAVASGIDVGSEIRTLTYLAKALGWGLKSDDAKPTIPASISDIKLVG